MATSASFHRNVLLLTQVIPPNDEFKKHFREGMFDKPNTAGFLHVSYYLLTVYDSESFKKVVEWPVMCKKTEAKYRNSVKDYLTMVTTENPDISFPNILMSHLIHAGGSKFTMIMWKLSQVVLRRFITRETTHKVPFCPQVGCQKNLTKKYFQEANAKIDSNILNQIKIISQMENTLKYTLEHEKELLTKIIADIFEKEESIKNISEKAPVHPSIKKHLTNINDEEIITMWKTNIRDSLKVIEKKNKILKDLEQLTYKASNLVLSYSSDLNILDGKQLQEVNLQEKSESLPPDVQCLLFQLYKDDKLVLHNFILLLNFVLKLLHQRLKMNVLEDYSDCLLQLDASSRDAKSALDILQMYHLEITKLMAEAQDNLCQKNVMTPHDNTMLPIVNNALIMLSPLIKINTNLSIQENDLQKRVQLTPIEAAHKPLFARYERLKQNPMSGLSKLRENLLVSKINFDDTLTPTNTERQTLHVNIVPNKNVSFKPTEKYSRLFASRSKRNNRAASNMSTMSIPCSSKANSTMIGNVNEEIHDMSKLSLNISGKSICNASLDFTTPEKVTTAQNRSVNTSEMEDVVNEFPYKNNLLDTCTTVNLKITDDYDNDITTTGRIEQPRRSIGDLVERYKKLLEASNRTPSPKINYEKRNNK